VGRTLADSGRALERPLDRAGLRGHGRSSHAAPYGYGRHAADVAALLDTDDDIVVLAHSMGGPVGLALATQWFGVRVRAVAAFAVKPDFNAEEVAGIRSVAAKGIAGSTPAQRRSNGKSPSPACAA